MAGKTLSPKQTRSRQPLERLSKAALDVLEDRGLDGTTIPRIATKAGLSPGAVYRRFQDDNDNVKGTHLEGE
ncbi:MAG: helix-turn-helix domain-containing protein [Terriglobia bacterium]